MKRIVLMLMITIAMCALLFSCNEKCFEPATHRYYVETTFHDIDNNVYIVDELGNRLMVLDSCLDIDDAIDIAYSTEHLTFDELDSVTMFNAYYHATDWLY